MNLEPNVKVLPGKEVLLVCDQNDQRAVQPLLQRLLVYLAGGYLCALALAAAPNRAVLRYSHPKVGHVPRRWNVCADPNDARLVTAAIAATEDLTNTMIGFFPVFYLSAPGAVP